jgi:hypothetical protein
VRRGPPSPAGTEARLWRTGQRVEVRGHARAAPRRSARRDRGGAPRQGGPCSAPFLATLLCLARGVLLARASRSSATAWTPRTSRRASGRRNQVPQLVIRSAAVVLPPAAPSPQRCDPRTSGPVRSCAAPASRSDPRRARCRRRASFPPRSPAARRRRRRCGRAPAHRAPDRNPPGGAAATAAAAHGRASSGAARAGSWRRRRTRCRPPAGRAAQRRRAPSRGRDGRPIRGGFPRRSPPATLRCMGDHDPPPGIRSGAAPPGAGGGGGAASR